jgi:hypothetical protein
MEDVGLLVLTLLFGCKNILMNFLLKSFSTAEDVALI